MNRISFGSFILIQCLIFLLILWLNFLSSSYTFLNTAINVFWPHILPRVSQGAGHCNYVTLWGKALGSYPPSAPSKPFTCLYNSFPCLSKQPWFFQLNLFIWFPFQTPFLWKFSWFSWSPRKSGIRSWARSLGHHPPGARTEGMC